MSRRALLAAVLTGALLVGAAGATVEPASARPPPETPCAVCTDSLAENAEAHGVDLSVGESSLRVALRANGNATWTARVALNPAGARTLARNDSLRREVVTATMDRYAGPTLGGLHPGTAVEDSAGAVCPRRARAPPHAGGPAGRRHGRLAAPGSSSGGPAVARGARGVAPGVPRGARRRRARPSP